MGYDDCVGINQNTPRLSAWDRLGAYYAYTWGHRRSLLMGAIDDVDDYAFDGTGRTGILWQTSRDAKFELWTSTASAGENIEFETSALRRRWREPVHGWIRCTGPRSPRARPAGGNTGDLDVLAHGPA
jgi:hypothetical protein